MFHNCSEGKNLADLHQSYGKKDVGLQDDIRWVMTSFVGLWVFISGFVSRRLMKVLGGRSFTTMASAFRVVGMTWYANIPWRVKQLWTMNVGSFLGSFGIAQWIANARHVRVLAFPDWPALGRRFEVA